MVDKNLMNIGQVSSVNTDDMLYVVQNGTTDGRVSVDQILSAGVKSVNSKTGDVSIVAGQNVTVSSNIDDQIVIGAELSIVRTPTPTSPISGATEVSVTVTLEASSYANLYGVARDYREFQVDIASGDFSSPIRSVQVNSDTWMADPQLPDNTELKWRCRDVDIDGAVSGWSEQQSFTTYDVYIVTPTITQPTDGGYLLDKDEPFLSSTYSAVNTTETHAASYWEVYNNLSVLVHSSGRDTTNLVSYQAPLGVITAGGQFSVRVRYEGSAGWLSDWSVPVGFEGVGAGYGNYLVTSHSASPSTMAVYGRDVDTFYKLTDPEQPVVNGGVIDFSPDGQHVAVAQSSSPFLLIYKRTGDTFSKLANIDTYPTSGISGLCYSNDGVYLAMSLVAAPRIAIYKRDGDNYTKLANPTTLPTNYGRCTFSPDGVYLAFAIDSIVLRYKRSGDTFTNITNISVASGVGECSFSPNSEYLAVACTGTPNLAVYKKGTGDAYTKLPDITTRPSFINAVNARTKFSPDGNYLFAAGEIGGKFFMYKRVGDTFTLLGNPTTIPTGASCVGVSWDPTSTYFALSYYNDTQTLYIYKRAGDTFTKLPNQETMPPVHCHISQF